MPITIESLFADGPVLLPGDDGYDDERAGYNLIVEHHPAVIVGATGAADVVAAVDFARDRNLAVAVQATGHGVSVAADGAMLINTRRMDGVRIDPVDRTARVEAGVRSRRLVQEAAVHGLAPLNGSSPDVGVVSYVLGGGVGILGRRYGYAADHVRTIDVVTADGVLRTVSADRDPDLFWALRGGKGNFGVVVAMEIDLFPVSRLYGGGLWFDADSTPAALHAYADWVEQVPDEMGSSVLMIRLPDAPGIPAPIRGRFVTHIRIAFIGSEQDGRRWVQPLRDTAPPLLDTVGDMPYLDVGTIHDEPTTPVPFYARNTVLANIDHDAIDALLHAAGPATDAPYLVEVRHLDGAFSIPPKVANAIGRRDGGFILYTGSVAAPGRLDALRRAHNAVHAAMSPWSTGGVCPNFLSGPEITTDELRSGFRPVDFTRLTELKHHYDPDNIFRVNHNLVRTPHGAAAPMRRQAIP
jgi:FAD/FMN-containing dehydrogenase